MIDGRDPKEIEREDELLVRKMGIGFLIALPIITVGIAIITKPKRGPPDFWLFVHGVLAILGPFLLLATTAFIGIVVARRKRNRYPRRSKLVTIACSVVLLWCLLQVANHTDILPFAEVHFWVYPFRWFLLQVGLVVFLLIALHDTKKEEHGASV